MTLSNKMIERFKNKPDQSMWNYIIALQQLQNALFELEKDDNFWVVHEYSLFKVGNDNSEEIFFRYN